MKNVLVVAYYFPPMGMGGTQRAAKFVKYLPDFGWRPHVVTVRDVAYYAHDTTLANDVAGATTHRTASLDPQRLLHLWYSARKKPRATGPRHAGGSELNRLLNGLFVPDTKLLWLPFALVRALRVLKSENIACVLTTSPPHSAHLLGFFLKKLTGTRWVADFRDGWADGNFQYEPTPLHRWANKAMQKLVLSTADEVVAVSAGLTQKLQAGFPSRASDFHTIYNGFDSQDFKQANEDQEERKCLRIVFAGTLSGMAPIAGFLRALRNFLDKNESVQDDILVEFAGAVLDGGVHDLVSGLGLQRVVTFTGYVSHHQAVAKMCAADLLLYPVAEHASRDFVPGKTFEYLASAKPVLAIGPRVEGVTLLEQNGSAHCFSHDDENGIAGAISSSWQNWKKGQKDTERGQGIDKFERRHLTGKLAELLDSGSDNP